MEIVSQAPTTPDLTFLAGLPPAVGISALATIVIVQLLYFVGPGLRDRFRKPAVAAAEPAVETSPQLPVVPAALPQAIDQADRISADFIAYLKGQLEARDRRISELERQVEQLERDLDRIRWQRGDGR